jgi:hypothetical protein
VKNLTSWISLGPDTSLRLEVNKFDIWIGAYFDRRESPGGDMGWDLWICLLPCLPIHITYLNPIVALSKSVTYK